MTWTNEFTSRALDGLPKDKYRQRVQAELTDHLLELADELEAGGYVPEEAQARALELMGDPTQLNPSFQERWVLWASNWKYFLSSLLKTAIHSALVNTLVRWIMLMPIVLMGRGILFDWLEAGHLMPVIAFTLINFLPGLLFSVRELHERFAIHPRRTILLFFGLLMVWALDASPWIYPLLPNHVLLTPLNIFAVVFIVPVLIGQFPLELLAMKSSPVAYYYLLLSFLLSILFALFYRPKSSKPFLLSDKT